MPPKQLQCKECGRILTRRDNLEHHMRIHTGEKPEKCSICSRPFRRRWDLEQHTKTHFGDKQFSCPGGHRFLRERDLRRHLSSDKGRQCLRAVKSNSDTTSALRPFIPTSLWSSSVYYPTELLPGSCSQAWLPDNHISLSSHMAGMVWSEDDSSEMMQVDTADMMYSVLGSSTVETLAEDSDYQRVQSWLRSSLQRPIVSEAMSLSRAGSKPVGEILSGYSPLASTRLDHASMIDWECALWPSLLILGPFSPSMYEWGRRKRLELPNLTG